MTVGLVVAPTGGLIEGRVVGGMSEAGGGSKEDCRVNVIDWL